VQEIGEGKRPETELLPRALIVLDEVDQKQEHQAKSRGFHAWVAAKIQERIIESREPESKRDIRPHFKGAQRLGKNQKQCPAT